jgi:hypothetical protein
MQTLFFVKVLTCNSLWQQLKKCSVYPFNTPTYIFKKRFILNHLHSQVELKNFTLFWPKHRLKLLNRNNNYHAINI